MQYTQVHSQVHTLAHTQALWGALTQWPADAETLTAPLPSSPTPAWASGGDDPALRDLTLGDLLAWAAMTAPDRTALVAGCAEPEHRREWTYAELYTQALRVAHALRCRAQVGERVALWADNSPEWVMLEFGAAMAGVILVPLPPAMNSDELEHALKSSGACVVVLSTGVAGQAMLSMVQALAPRCRSLREVIRLDRWAAFIASGDDALGPLPAVASGDVAMLQYSAGSGQAARGARLRHISLVNSAAFAAERLGVSDADIWVCALPLHQPAGCALNVLGAAAKRATLVLAEAATPELLLELIDSYRANVLLAPPALLQATLAHKDLHSFELSTLRGVATGGAPMAAELPTRCYALLGVQLRTMYGHSEAAPAYLMCDDASALGTPLPGVQVRIVGADGVKTAACGEVGEICTRGYHVMAGYHGLTEASAQAIDGEGWLHSGDLGRMDAQGQVHWVGRLTDRIVHASGLVDAHELEAFLCRHPRVSQAAVLGLPDADRGETLAVFVRPDGELSLSKEELQKHLRQHVSPQETPRYWFVVNRLPTNSSGKVQKFKLREHFAQGMLVAL
jgi:fatty-acyl-CoA synthase